MLHLVNFSSQSTSPVTNSKLGRFEGQQPNPNLKLSSLVASGDFYFSLVMSKSPHPTQCDLQLMFFWPTLFPDVQQQLSGIWRGQPAPFVTGCPGEFSPSYSSLRTHTLKSD